MLCEFWLSAEGFVLMTASYLHCFTVDVSSAVLNHDCKLSRADPSPQVGPHHSHLQKHSPATLHCSLPFHPDSRPLLPLVFPGFVRLRLIPCLRKLLSRLWMAFRLAWKRLKVQLKRSKTTQQTFTDPPPRGLCSYFSFLRVSPTSQPGLNRKGRGGPHCQLLPRETVLLQ